MPSWWKRSPVEERSESAPYATLADPATARLLGDWGGYNYSGENVNETSALSLSAFYRAVSLVSQGIGSLPLKSYRTLDNGERERVASFLDNPAGPDSLTPFEWKERVILHLMIRGNAFLYHVYNTGGALVGLYPIHPRAVEVVPDANAVEGKTFKVTLADGTTERLTVAELTHVPGPMTDGLVGYSPLTMGRNSLGTALAGDRAAAGMFNNGALIGGVLVPRAGEVLNSQDVEDIAADLDTNLYGRMNAGKVPILNRVLEFMPWQMTNEDAQWLQTRMYSLDEIARWTGVPPFLLMNFQNQTSWGTGLGEQNKNLAQYVLLPWCSRIVERVSRLLPQPRFAEFDFAGLEAGSASEQIALGISQVNGGILTLNEFRRIQNLSPLEGGDQLRIPSGVMLQAQLEASAAATEAEIAPPDAIPADPALEATP